MSEETNELSYVKAAAEFYREAYEKEKVQCANYLDQLIATKKELSAALGLVFSPYKLKYYLSFINGFHYFEKSVYTNTTGAQ